jgi:uncharacterized membrane protein YdcZ (DUF606 family)
VFFFGGAFLLSTRFERRLEILDPRTYVHIATAIGEHAWKTVRHPIDHPMRIGKHLGKRAASAVSGLVGGIADGQLLVVRTKVRVRMVRGFWWYLAAILIAVPYVLILTWLSKEVGVTAAFVTVRLGLAFGCLVLVVTAFDEIRRALKDRKAVAVAFVKEPIGILIGFLLAYAYANAELGAVRAISSFESAGIFLVGLLLARLGILQESLRKQDIIQKAAGVCCMITGSLVLFL